MYGVSVARNSPGSTFSENYQGSVLMGEYRIPVNKKRGYMEVIDKVDSTYIDRPWSDPILVFKELVVWTE